MQPAFKYRQKLITKLEISQNVTYIKKNYQGLIMNFKSLISLSLLFNFTALFISGILRFLDNSPIIATMHMSFAFALCIILYFHIFNNWNSITTYIKNEKKELALAILTVLIIFFIGLFIHYSHLGTTVI